MRSRASRSRWVAAVALLAAVGIFWAWSEETDPPAAEPSPAPVTVEAPEPPAPLLAAVPLPVDAGAPLPPIDAGAPRVTALASSDAPRIDELMKRWRDALAPLFRQRWSAQPLKPLPVIAVSGEGKASAEGASAPDAGCVDGVHRLPLNAVTAIDVVVAIDTSGSMSPELRDVVRWVAELELALRNESGVAFQLLVVADQRALERVDRETVIDGGKVELEIGSRDALETLIAAAREGPSPRWQTLLRSHAAKHLVIVTDDEAEDSRGLPYLEKLVRVAGGALGTAAQPGFALHLLGGFQATALLRPDEPPATALCAGGVAAGLAYQALAQKTGGLRASLCAPETGRALSRELIASPHAGAGSACVWLLDEGTRITDVFALKRGAHVSHLSEAPYPNACVGRRNGYRTEAQMLGLCSETCAHLIDAGVDAIEVQQRCDR